MTAFDRFDPFERRISVAIEEIAATRLPDYLDDTLRQTARTSQRPRWSFPERWLPMDTTLQRPILFGRRPVQFLALLLLLLALVGGAIAAYVGSQPRLPAPFGPAGNGQLIYGTNGDLYARDSLTGAPRLLLGGPGDQSGVIMSPDGRLVAYDNYVGDNGELLAGEPYAWVAELDGSNPRRILDRPYTFLGFAWAPDSRSIAVLTDPIGMPELWIAPVDGSGARRLDFDSMWVWEAAWDPVRPGVLLVRGEDKQTREVDLYYIGVDGAILSTIEMTGLNINGPRFEFSGLAFSPDGQTIAYNSVEAIELPVNRFRVHLMHRDGSADRAIAAPLEALYSQAWPVFSPDGTRVLMDSWETREDAAPIHQLAIAPVDGSEAARRIGPILDDDNRIKAWSPDGSRILLCGCQHQELYSIDPVLGTFEKLPWQGDLPGWQRVVR